MDLSRFTLIEEANKIGELIWKEVITWSFFDKDTLGKQVVRSCDSISANLSEAYGRYTYGERIRFCYYSRGSLCESINWIQKAKKRDLLDEKIAIQMLRELDVLSRKINVHIKSMKANLNKP